MSRVKRAGLRYAVPGNVDSLSSLGGRSEFWLSSSSHDPPFLARLPTPFPGCILLLQMVLDLFFTPEAGRVNWVALAVETEGVDELAHCCKQCTSRTRVIGKRQDEGVWGGKDMFPCNILFNH